MKLVREYINEKLSGSEAVYGFVGWLTTQDEVTKMGSKEDCAPIVDKIAKFIETNDLEEPRENWHKELRQPELKEFFYMKINEEKIRKSEAIIEANREHFKNMILHAMKKFRLSKNIAADMIAHGIVKVANEMP